MTSSPARGRGRRRPSPRGRSRSNYSAAPQEEEPEDKKPGLFERFKETSAYDRLQAEVGSLGDRFIEELSRTAHNVVLPALFNKIKELFGVDLSSKQAQGQRTPGAQTAQAGVDAPGTNTQAASASASSPARWRSICCAAASRGCNADSPQKHLRVLLRRLAPIRRPSTSQRLPNQSLIPKSLRAAIKNRLFTEHHHWNPHHFAVAEKVSQCAVVAEDARIE